MSTNYSNKSKGKDFYGVKVNKSLINDLLHNYCCYTGCGKCWSMDGNWKLMFPHCMYPVETIVPGLPGLNYPDVCQNQPLTSKHAFCKHHHAIASEMKIPTDVKGFIQYCGGIAEISKLFEFQSAWLSLIACSTNETK